MALVAGNAGGLATVLEERRHMTKALANGIAALSGVMAAELAAAGFDGSDDVLGSVHGPLAWAETPAAEVARGLGADFAVMGSNFKFYSAGYPIHAPAEAAMTLVETHGLDLADIAALTIGSNSRSLNTVGGRAMHSIDMAHMVAVAVVHGRLDFDTAHDPAALERPEVLRLKSVIRYAPDPELEQRQPRGRGARATIELRDGRRLSLLVEHPRGHAARGPVTWDDLRGKWDGLLAARLGPERLERYVALCRGLELVDDVGQLARAVERESR
jgi:2-methylcitrate dehydratase PrpD